MILDHLQLYASLLLIGTFGRALLLSGELIIIGVIWLCESWPVYGNWTASTLPEALNYVQARSTYTKWTSETFLDALLRLKTIISKSPINCLSNKARLGFFPKPPNNIVLFNFTILGDYLNVTQLITSCSMCARTNIAQSYLNDYTNEGGGGLYFICIWLK